MLEGSDLRRFAASKGLRGNRFVGVQRRGRVVQRAILRVTGLGIGIVTLTDKQTYTAESVDADPTDVALFGT